jgi:hypothetical protein
MSEIPIIIETGRGPQLSTCRITVQDVVPYLSWSNRRIREVMPVLRDDEVETIRRYVAAHFNKVMAEDRAIRARSQARQSADEADEEHDSRLKRLAAWRATNIG